MCGLCIHITVACIHPFVGKTTYRCKYNYCSRAFFCFSSAFYASILLFLHKNHSLICYRPSYFHYYYWWAFIANALKFYWSLWIFLFLLVAKLVLYYLNLTFSSCSIAVNTGSHPSHEPCVVWLNVYSSGCAGRHALEISSEQYWK